MHKLGGWCFINMAGMGPLAGCKAMHLQVISLTT